MGTTAATGSRTTVTYSAAHQRATQPRHLANRAATARARPLVVPGVSHATGPSKPLCVEYVLIRSPGHPKSAVMVVLMPSRSASGPSPCTVRSMSGNGSWKATVCAMASIHSR